MKKVCVFVCVTLIIAFFMFNWVYAIEFDTSFQEEYEDKDYNYDNDNFESYDEYDDYNKECIEDYDIEIYINEDGRIDITEKISVYSLNENIKHGIYRDFPTHYINKKTFIDVNSVECDGEEIKYTLSSINRGTRIKIGDEDETVSIGRHEYVIKYTTDRQIIYNNDYDEFYWNIIGTGWDFDINHCHAMVYFPDGTNFIKENLKIYTGVYGEKGKNKDVIYNFLDDENAIEFDVYDTFYENEAFTIDVFIEKGALIEPSFEKRIVFFIEDNVISLILFVGLLVLLIWQYFKWKKFGKEPKKNIIIPRYYPPKNIDPAELKYIKSMGSMNRAVESIIINLAIKGYFIINDEKNVFVINKVVDSKIISKLEPLTENEKEVYDSFDKQETLTYSPSFSKKLVKIRQNIGKRLKKKYNGTLFIQNNQVGVKTLRVILIIYLLAFIVGFFVNSYATESAMQVLVIVGIFVIAVFYFLSIILKKKTISFTPIIFIFLILFSILFMIIDFITNMSNAYIESITICLIFICYVIDVVAILNSADRYTDEGMLIEEEIEGFEMFINTAKDDDFEEKTPEMFDKYFAFAYVLELENKWADKFKDTIDKSTYTPYWCSSKKVYLNGGFNTTLFVSNFSDNMFYGMSNATSLPSVNGDSRFSDGSGYSGGGFSGGGGGGRRPEEAGKVY